MNKKQHDPGAVALKTGGCAPLLAVAQVAELLNVRPRHIYRLVSERRIPYIKLGKLLRFEPAAITEWIQASRRNAPILRPPRQPQRWRLAKATRGRTRRPPR